MRKIKYKVWQREADQNKDFGRVEKSGFFLSWGISSEIDDKGILVDTMAIIEEKDGKVILVHPSLVRFEEPTE